MGLDQYFFVKTEGVEGEESIEAAYFRKCNMLHTWVTAYCEREPENCEEIKLPRSAVEKIISDAAIVLSNLTLGPKILPTADGFFFGSTDYDDIYIRKVTHIRDDLREMLDSFDARWFYYVEWW